MALGSGGARGFAHIGVIEVLAERGFEVAAVAGSSMGALVGGVTAAGRLAEFTEWAVGLKQRDVLFLLDPKWALPGVLAADRLIDHLDGFLAEAMIEELPVPYTAVATDITSRREVWFQKGLLRSAIRASIAIPGLITPVVADGRVLADGGLLNPVPIEPTAAVPTDLTVAVSLVGRRPGHESAAPIRTVAHRRLRRRKAEAELRLSDVLVSSLDAMQDMIARYRMAGLPPDVHISVPVTACGALEFHRAGEMVALGRELAARALDDAGIG
ncbi:hypothetical protein GCM10010172_74690 [Paractinoplanes ferrugineus]